MVAGYSRKVCDAEIRQLCIDDLDDVMELQQENYAPELLEGREVFESIIRHQAQFCRAIVHAESIVGYLFAHLHARDGQPPALAVALHEQSFPSDGIVFIHDACISKEFQGRGLLRLMLSTIDQREGMACVAVQGAEVVWKKLGFLAVRR